MVFLCRHNLIKMVLLLSDNIKMVICSAEEVRVRYSFMKDVAMLHTKNSMQESALKLNRKIENLSTKVDEVSLLTETWYTVLPLCMLYHG